MLVKYYLNRVHWGGKICPLWVVPLPMLGSLCSLWITATRKAAKTLVSAQQVPREGKAISSSSGKFLSTRHPSAESARLDGGEAASGRLQACKWARSPCLWLPIVNIISADRGEGRTLGLPNNYLTSFSWIFLNLERKQIGPTKERQEGKEKDDSSRKTPHPPFPTVRRLLRSTLLF